MGSESCLRRLFGGHGRLPGLVGRCDGKRPKNGLYRHSYQTGLGGDQSPDKHPKKRRRQGRPGACGGPKSASRDLLGRPWGSLSRSWAGPARSRRPKSPSRHAQNVQKGRHKLQAEPGWPKICVQCESKNVPRNRLFCSVFQERRQTMFRYPVIFAKQRTSAAPGRRRSAPVAACRRQHAGHNAQPAAVHARAQGRGRRGGEGRSSQLACRLAGQLRTSSMHESKQANKHASKQASKQASKHAGRQAGRQASKQASKRPRRSCAAAAPQLRPPRVCMYLHTSMLACLHACLHACLPACPVADMLGFAKIGG